MKAKILIPIFAVILIFMPLASALIIEDFEDISDWDKEWGHLDFYGQSNDSVFGNYSMIISSAAEYGSWAGKVETPRLNSYWNPGKDWSGYIGLTLWMKRGTTGRGTPLCNPTIRFKVMSNNSGYNLAYYFSISNTEWQKYFFPFSTNMTAVQKIIIDIDGCNNGGMYDLYIDNLELVTKTPTQQATISGDNITVNSISDAYALVSWNTTAAGDSRVEYGTSPTYSMTAINLTNSTSHSVLLNPLTPDTTYYLTAKTCNASGCIQSSNYTFHTLKTTNYQLAGCYIGAYGDWNDNGLSFSDFDKFESIATGINKHTAIVLLYKWWDSAWKVDNDRDKGDDFPIGDANLIDGHKSIIYITWEPRYTKTEIYYLDDVINGKWDTYIRNYALAAKAYNKTIFMRFLQEMNGNKYDWTAENNGNMIKTGFGDPNKEDGPERVVAAWKYAVDIFRSVGATNVQWIWSPTQHNSSMTGNLSDYYPGDNYVDWLSANGFNFGNPYMGFNDLFLKHYADLKGINSTKPIMLGDFGSVEGAGNKSAWIQDAFAQIKSKYPSIKVFNWFGKTMTEGNTLVDSGLSSKSAFQQAMNDPYYIAYPYSMNSGSVGISNITVTSISDTYAVVIWKTASPSNTSIQYTNGINSNSTTKSELNLDHMTVLYPLASSSTYYYHIQSCTASLCEESAQLSFTTLPKTNYSLQGAYTGAYVDYNERDGYGVKQSDFDKFESIATGINKHAAMILMFQTWGASCNGAYTSTGDSDGDGGQDFPIASANFIANHNSILHITWEPRFCPTPGKYVLDNIIEGRWDSYINNYATAIKNYNHTVIVRLMHEMDIGQPWGGPNNGGSQLTGFGDPNKEDGPERLIAAWRHVVDIFRSKNITNVEFDWAPWGGTSTWGGTMDYAKYYPGDSYVDWLGVSDFNYGTNAGTWKSFDDMFFYSYASIHSLSPSKPMMISEFAAGEIGGNKSAWIQDAFTKIKEKYPSYKAFNWFNIYKESNFLVDSSPESKEAFQQVMSDPYYKQWININDTSESSCIANWTSAFTGWTSCSKGDSKTRTKYYRDTNNCNVSAPQNETETSVCDYCISAWQNINGPCRSDNTFVIGYVYTNTCCKETGLSSDCSIPLNATSSCDYCTPDWKEMNTSCQSDNRIIGYYTDKNNCYALTGLSSDNNPPEPKVYPCPSEPIQPDPNPIQEKNTMPSICMEKCGGNYPYWQGQIWIEPLTKDAYPKRWSLSSECTGAIGTNGIYGPTNLYNMKNNDPYWTYWTMFCSSKEDSYKICTSCGGDYPNNGGAIWTETGDSNAPKNFVFGDQCSSPASQKNSNWLSVCSKDNDVAFCSRSCGGEYSQWHGQIWLATGTQDAPKNNIYGDGCSEPAGWKNDNWIMLCGKN